MPQKKDLLLTIGPGHQSRLEFLCSHRSSSSLRCHGAVSTSLLLSLHLLMAKCLRGGFRWLSQFQALTVNCWLLLQKQWYVSRWHTLCTWATVHGAIETFALNYLLYTKTFIAFSEWIEVSDFSPAHRLGSEDLIVLRRLFLISLTGMRWQNDIRWMVWIREVVSSRHTSGTQ